MVKKMRILIPFAAYILFFILLGSIFFHPVRCSFEKEITAYEGSGNLATEEDYCFGIDTAEIDNDDYFKLAQIRGWLVKKNEERYGPVGAELLIKSNSDAYKVKLYSEKRLDVYYTDQSDGDSKNVYVGFIAKFPTDHLPKGEYQIGFLVKENSHDSILWTEKFFTIV